MLSKFFKKKDARFEEMSAFFNLVNFVISNCENQRIFIIISKSGMKDYMYFVNNFENDEIFKNRCELSNGSQRVFNYVIHFFNTNLDVNINKKRVFFAFCETESQVRELTKFSIETDEKFSFFVV